MQNFGLCLRFRRHGRNLNGALRLGAIDASSREAALMPPGCCPAYEADSMRRNLRRITFILRREFDPLGRLDIALQLRQVGTM